MKVVRLSGKVPLEALADLSEMMMRFKHEMEPEKATDDEAAYVAFIRHKIKTAFVYYLPHTGFCIVEPDFDPLVSCSHRHFFFMSRIYIVPEKRKSTAYSKLLFTAFREHKGQMYGVTYEGGQHDAVLAKRFRKIGTVYGRY